MRLRLEQTLYHRNGMKLIRLFFLFPLIGGFTLGPSVVFGSRPIGTLKQQCESNSKRESRPNPKASNGIDSPLDKRCKNDPRDFSALCVKWVAEKAAKAMDSDKKCKNKIKPELLMCIFRKEVYWKPTTIKLGNLNFKIDTVDTTPKRYCRRNSSCGLAQMTKNGVSTVLEGFAHHNLGGPYDDFWNMVGRAPKTPNKCEITKQWAEDRDTSAIMAATHLCVEVKRRSLRGWNSDSRVLARDYNGGGRRNQYANWVQSCIKKGKADVAAWNRRSGVDLAAMARAIGGQGAPTIQAQPSGSSDGSTTRGSTSR